MTFDDDFVQLEGPHATIHMACKQLGLDWPPPHMIKALGGVYNRDSYSKITDEQRAGMTHVARGAVYLKV